MANKILTGDTYHDEIRGRLGVSVSDLSDSDIDAPSVLPLGELKVIKSVSDYASLSGDDSVYLYAATIAMVAAILAPSLASRLKKSKKDFDFSFENQNVDWRKRGIELMDEAYTFISQISTQETTEFNPMGVSGPTRANAPTTNPTIYSVDNYMLDE